MTYALLELMQQYPAQEAQTLLRQLAEQVSPNHPDWVIETGLGMLGTLYEKTIVCLGCAEANYSDPCYLPNPSQLHVNR
nr:hypothetical protein [Methylocucumis oryzae]